MNHPRGIVLLEGADASGKTTLARCLVERYHAKYIHSTVRRQVWRYHVGALRLAIRHARDRLVVLDRHFLSELVYGSVFRGGPAYDVGARCLDRILRRYGAVTVLCAPRDLEAQERRWRDGRETGKHEHFPRVRDVIARYADLRDGNVGHPGDGYLDQLIRFGDFTERDDVLVYDLDRHPTPQSLRTFAGRIAKRLHALCVESFHDGGDNLVGRPDANRSGFLLVGESLSPTIVGRLPRWPWCDRDDHLSAATWLNRALHSIAAREDRLVFTNAVDPDDRLPALLDRLNVRPIALGRTAAQRIQELRYGSIELPHPQYHRRFYYGDGPEGYGKMLREAML